MQNLTVFDGEFNLIGELEDDKHFDLALEISNKLQGKVEGVSDEAEDLLWIEQHQMRYTFIKLMLFVDAEINIIADAMDMKEELVTAYKKLFFDVHKIRGGHLGRTQFYEDIFAKYNEGSQEFAFGIMLREANLGGEDIILAQFDINMRDMSVTRYKDLLQKKAIWRENIVERSDEQDYDALHAEMKSRESVLNLVTKATSKDDKAKISDLGALVRVLESMNKMDLGRGQLQLRTYDTKTEEVFEAELLEPPKQTDKEEIE